MPNGDELKFRLQGEAFQEISPEIKFSNLNAMAFVAMIQRDQPDKIFIEFDGESSSILFLMDIAGEVGYFANIEENKAVLERV